MKLLRILTIVVAVFSYFAMSAQTISHIVERGETLESVADRFGVSKEAIIELNPDVDKMMYSGMKLYIPQSQANPTVRQTENEQNTVADKQPVVAEQRESEQVRFEGKNKIAESAQYSEKRFPIFLSAQFQTSSFEHFKEAGWYGIGMIFSSISQWGRFHVGANIDLMFDWGLVDSEDVGCNIAFGPSARYDIVDKLFVNCPVDVVCLCYFPSGTTDTKTEWGMKIAPSLHYFFTEKIGAFVGPQMCVAFESNSRATFGMQFGLSYIF